MAASSFACSTRMEPVLGLDPRDEYGFQPIVVFDGDGRMIAAVLRPPCRPSGRQIVKWLRRLLAALRAHWPRVEIMLRGDSHFCTPEVLRFCRANPRRTRRSSPWRCRGCTDWLFDRRGGCP